MSVYNRGIYTCTGNLRHQPLNGYTTPRHQKSRPGAWLTQGVGGRREQVHSRTHLSLGLKRSLLAGPPLPQPSFSQRPCTSDLKKGQIALAPSGPLTPGRGTHCGRLLPPLPWRASASTASAPRAGGRGLIVERQPRGERHAAHSSGRPASSPSPTPVSGVRATSRNPSVTASRGHRGSLWKRGWGLPC